MSSGKACIKRSRSEMAKGWLGGDPSYSSKVVRIHSIKALNSWQEAFSSGSLQVRKRSECSGFFWWFVFMVLEGLHGARVIFFPSLGKV